jgi:hypothetical protein
MCLEDWKAGLSYFEPYLIAAFSKIPMAKRIDFVHSVLEIPSTLAKQVLSIPKLFCFLQWMQANYKSEHVIKSDLVRSLLQKPSANPHKDRDMKLIRYLTRSLFAKRVNYDEESVDISDVRLEPSHTKPQTKSLGTHSSH